MTTQAEIVALRKKHPALRSPAIAKLAKCSGAYACTAARRAGVPFGRMSHPGWTRPIKPPKHAHPLVRRFVEIANTEQTTLKKISERAGISDGTMTSWRRKHMPYLDTFEAALNVLGYQLVIRKKGGDE